MLTGKPVPPEVSDLAEVVRRECRTFDDFLYKIRYVRTRPYSRISAIVSKSRDSPTLEDVCRYGPNEPPYTEIRLLYNYVKKLNVCGKPRVAVYRGGTEGIKPGDWVYLERGRAETHAEIHGYGVYEKEVPPEDVVWAGTSEDEWFYVPKNLQGYFASLEDFWNSAVGDPEERAGEEAGEERRRLEEWLPPTRRERRLEEWVRRV